MATCAQWEKGTLILRTTQVDQLMASEILDAHMPVSYFHRISMGK